MDYAKFIELVRHAKPSQVYTGSASYKLKVTTNKDHTLQKIYKKSYCKHCNVTGIKEIMIQFKEPQRLSIFQACLIYMLFIENKKPMDYASYHKCVAGKRFIDNIQEVRK